MRIAVGADHAGYPLKVEVVRFLEEQGHEVTDLGTHSTDPVDFPVYARQVGQAVQLGKADRGVLVCGTNGIGNPTSGIAIGLMLELTRRIGYENARMKAGERWQTTIGLDLDGLTLGVLGLGKLGTRTARIAKAFGMKVIAWSQNLTPEKCKEAGVDYAGKEDLFRQADFVTIHLVLSQRSRGLVGAKELGLMKPTAYIINTSRGPIIDEAALLAALRENKIAGAGLDVFDVEPLPTDHPLRKLDNVVLTPHLGYVATQNYRAYFAGVVDDIRAFLDGKPVRVLD